MGGQCHKSLDDGPQTLLLHICSYSPHRDQEKNHVRLALVAMYEHRLDGFLQWLLVQLEWLLRAKRGLGVR